MKIKTTFLLLIKIRYKEGRQQSMEEVGSNRRKSRSSEAVGREPRSHQDGEAIIRCLHHWIEQKGDNAGDSKNA